MTTATATAAAAVHSGAPVGCSAATALEAGDDTCAWSEAPGEAMYARLAAAGLAPSMTGRVGATDEECWSACDQGGRTPRSSPAVASSSPSSPSSSVEVEAEVEPRLEPRLAGGASDVQPAEATVADAVDVAAVAGEAVATGAPAPEARVNETTEAAVQVDPDAEGGKAGAAPEVVRLRATVAQQRERAAEDSRQIAQLFARVADLERELSVARAALSPAQRGTLQPPPQQPAWQQPAWQQPTPTPTHVPPATLVPQPRLETPSTVVAPHAGALPPTPPRGSRARPVVLVDGAAPPGAAAAELAAARAAPPLPPPPPPPATTEAATGLAAVAAIEAPESPPLLMPAQPRHHTHQPFARRMQSELHLQEAGLAAADLATKLEALRAQARVLAEWPSCTATGGEGGEGGEGGGGGSGGGDRSGGAGGGMVAMAPPPPELPPFYVPPVSLVSDAAAEARTRWAAGAAQTNAEAVQALRALRSQPGDAVGGGGGSGAALSERLHALANSFRRDLASEQLQQAPPMRALHADASPLPSSSAAALPPPLHSVAPLRPLAAEATAVASHDAAITDSLLWLRGRQARSPLRASASAGMTGPAAAAACGLPPASAATSIGAPGRLSAIVSATLGVTPAGVEDTTARGSSSSWAQHAAQRRGLNDS